MNRMYLTALVLGVLFLATLGVTQSMGQPGQAATPPPPGSHPIAVIDFIRVFNECTQIKDLNEMIKKRTGDLGNEANQRREVIENKQVELSAFQPGSPDYEARRKDLVRLNVDANVWLKVTEDELERSKFEWTRIVYEKALAAATETAKEQGHDIVMQRTDFRPFELEPTVQSLRRVIKERTVVFNSAEVDITETVIGRMDAVYKAGGGKKQLGLTTPAK